MRKLLIPLVAAAVAVGVPGTAVSAAAGSDTAPPASGQSAETGSYIVVLKDSARTHAAVGKAAADMLRDLGVRGGQRAEVGRVYRHLLRGFSATLDASALATLKRNPDVAYVARNDEFSVQDVQSNPPSWGLDRIDQAALPLSNSYTSNRSGNGVSVYIVDTGVRTTNKEFNGRTAPGVSYIDDGYGTGPGPAGCSAHGTHVAGTVAGTTYGVAKRAKIVPVRVLGCDSRGSADNIISGLDWVAQNHSGPSVVNFSVGFDSGTNQAIDDAMARLTNSGVTVVVAAGNSATNACLISSANNQQLIVVGNSTNADARSASSNHGGCVSIWAPGDNIVSAANATDYATTTMTGTSMASPHVAGAAALYLETNPTATHAQVKQALVNNSASVTISDAKANSPAKLLNVSFLAAATGDTTAPTVPTGLSTSNTTSSTTTLSWSAATDNVKVTGYDVYNGTTLIARTNGTTVSAALTGLAAGTQHSLKVAARDAAGNASATSAAVSVSTPADTTNPTAPSNVGFGLVNSTSVTVTWLGASDNVGVAGYDVWVYKDGSWQKATSVGAAQSWGKVTGLSPNTTYYFDVSSRDAAGRNGYTGNSYSKKTTVTDSVAPTAPTQVTVTGSTALSLSLSWTASTDAVGVIEYDVFNGSEFLGYAAGDKTSVTLYGPSIQPGTTYNLTVKAYDASLNNTASTAVAATTPSVESQKPTIPTNLSSSNVTSTTVPLTWTASTDNVGVKGYDIYDGANLVGQVGATTSYTVTGLPPGSQHSFTVKARDAVGNISDASAVRSVQTLA